MKKTVPKVRGKPHAPELKHPAVAVGVNCSENRKTGQVAVTYVSQGSCPVTCPHKDNGCYAEYGHAGRVTHRLNDAGAGLTPVEYARAEAAQIDGMSPLRDLRLHVVGDCRTEPAAKIVAAAATRYIERSAAVLITPATVWTYTHSWRLVPREAWGPVSVLASCETAEQVYQARARGYAAALVVDEFEGDKAYQCDGFRIVPCPYQTRGVKCVDCRLCLDDCSLFETDRVIGFRAHGAGRSSVVKSLEVL